MTLSDALWDTILILLVIYQCGGANSPCIMCVQYIGGYHEYIGGYHEYTGGYHEYIGGYHEYIARLS